MKQSTTNISRDVRLSFADTVCLITWNKIVFFLFVLLPSVQLITSQMWYNVRVSCRSIYVIFHFFFLSFSFISLVMSSMVSISFTCVCTFCRWIHENTEKNIFSAEQHNELSFPCCAHWSPFFLIAEDIRIFVIVTAWHRSQNTFYLSSFSGGLFSCVKNFILQKKRRLEIRTGRKKIWKETRFAGNRYDNRAKMKP